MKFFILCAFVFLSAGTVQAEQYRSKELIDPNNSLGDSANLSIQELENELLKMNNSYAKSSTQRHLARHYLKNKQYDKTIEFYEDAIAQEGLSSFANVEMLKELIQVYMIKPDYPQAVSALKKYQQQGGKLDADLYLLKAFASYKTKNYVGASQAVDNALKTSVNPSEKVLKKSISIYYQIGNTKKTAELLKKLLQRNPNQPDTWHQLVSVLLKLGHKKEALTLLNLAWEKQVDFSHQQVILLADLLARDGNVYRAAQILEEGINKQLVKPDGKDYQRLFSYWLSAKEKTKALKALNHAARLSKDTELNLYLAQLYMELEKWPAMLQAILDTCERPLEDRFVGRANLLLGISQLKMDLTEDARRSLLNATMVGGSGEKAGQYLRFMEKTMNTKPPSKRELRMFVGPCQSASTTSKWANTSVSRATKKALKKSQSKVSKQTSRSKKQANIKFDIKTIPRTTFFYAQYKMSKKDFAEGITGKAISLGMSAAKSGGTIDGAMHFIFDKPVDKENSEVSVKLAFPVKGRPKSRGKNKVMKSPPFKCAYLKYEGTAEGIEKAWQELQQSVEASGYDLSGESRQLFGSDNKMGSDTVKTELQIGVL